MNEDTTLKWFDTAIKLASKIPFQRFNREEGGGSVVDGSAEITRDEITFHSYIRRLRSNFKELLVKPIYIQMILDFPELKDDTFFRSSIQCEFTSMNLFEKWKLLNNLKMRSEIVSSLSSQFVDVEGKSYLHPEWLARNIMELTEEQIEDNNKYKLASQAAVQGSPDMGGGFGGGMDEFGGGMGTTETPGAQTTAAQTPAAQGTTPAQGGAQTPPAQGPPAQF